MRKLVVCGIAYIVGCFVFGCGAISSDSDTRENSEGYLTKNSGLHRTDFGKWEPHRFQKCGFTSEVPIDTYSIFDTPQRAALLMHPVWPPAGVIDEPRCILEITIRRVSIGSNSTRRSKRNDDFWNWINLKHYEIEKMEYRNQIIFRYDVLCKNEHILQIDAVLQNVYGRQHSEYLVEDEEAIRRLLSSVKCMTD